MGEMSYLDTLLLYYEEEVEGEAYFAELAQAFDAPEHQAKLVLLGQVERHAAQALEPLLAKYGLTSDRIGALVQSGIAEARATVPDWAQVIAGMQETYPGYLESFRALEAMAPEEDRARLHFLSEHEVAALAFLALEQEAPERSGAPLEAYLQADAAQWTGHVTGQLSGQLLGVTP